MNDETKSGGEPRERAEDAERAENASEAPARRRDELPGPGDLIGPPTERSPPGPAATRGPAAPPGTAPAGTPAPPTGATATAAPPPAASAPAERPTLPDEDDPWGSPSPAPPAAAPPAAPAADEPWAERPPVPPVEAFEGARQLAEYVEEGYEIVLVVGIGGVGKTELLHSSRQRAFLSSFSAATRRAGRALPTAPGRLDTHPFAVGRRKVVFVDASGEHFASLYPELQRTGQIRPEQIGFLELVSKRLAGVVLLVDLRRLWGGAADDQQGARQEEVLAWVLQLLRWLEHGGRHDAESAIGFQEQVNRELRTMRRRLRVPVQLLLSKADELRGLAVPAPPGERWLAGAAGRGERRLFPLGERPLLLAYHHLPVLWPALATHVKHFRVDFAHSLITDPDSGAVTEDTANGLVYSLGWLLQPSWRWLRHPRLAPLFLGTREQVAVERTVDRVRGRGGRWRRLPDAEPLAR